ncbi:ornithine cyclodeaminase family protein [Wukongibacter baidiensis]|uniref:ornithine cyclodeaminase family protein n=1 Tax=Wukongibacter baidiensis TaxID=1723361 RepID=UPI003D7F537B
MLYLGQKDIDNLVSFDELMDNIELAFKIYEKKDFQMPDRIHLHHKEDTVLYMPCFTDSIFGTKIITVFQKNTEKKIPVIQGVMLLNDVDTGKPIAIIDGGTLTAYRTGAVGGVGVRHTTGEKCQAVGLVGAGIQGFYQLLFTAKARNIKRIYVFDIFKEKLNSFKEKLSEKLPEVEINIVEDIRELVEKSEIIITTTTSNKPVLPDDESLLKGKHIVAIGSYKPEMRELPEALFRLLDDMYIDTDFAMEESGDLTTPLKNNWIKKEQVKLFSKLLSDKSNIVNKKGNTTLFKSVGMALFDLVVAEFIYIKAMEKGIGQSINM